MSENLFLQAALTYARRGWQIVPVMPKEKKPWVASWQTEASIDPAIISKWWGLQPESNVGIQLGPRSGIIDVECDSMKAERELGELLGKAAPVTPTFAAKRGKHRLFQWAANLPFQDQAIVKHNGIEFRMGSNGKGVQSVFPPSIHPSGAVYSWLVSPDDVEPAELPPHVLAALAAPTLTLTVRGGELAADPGAAEGERHKRALSLVGGALANGHDPTKVAQDALAWAQRCRPPLPETEIIKIVGDLVARHQAKAPTTMTGAGLITTALNTIQAEPVSWLVPGYLPLGKLVLLAGQGGLGKSLITLHLAANLSSGRPCLNLQYAAAEPCEILIAALEDDYADTVVPRLAAADAHLGKIHRIDGVAMPAGKQLFSLACLSQLDQELAKKPNARLVIIDPVAAFLGGKTDDHKDAEVRIALDPLAELAARRQVTILIVKHLNKSESRDAARRVSGSAAYVNISRMAFIVCADPEDPDKRLLLPLKANVAQRPAGLVYRIERVDHYRTTETLSRCAKHLDAEQSLRLGEQLIALAWLGETNISADDALEPQRKSEADAKRAADWLRDFLKDGPRESLECVQAGNEALEQKSTLKWWRAVLKELGGLPRKAKSFQGQWVFCLPGQSPSSKESAKEAQFPTSVLVDSLDSLASLASKTNPKEAKEAKEALSPHVGVRDSLANSLDGEMLL